MTGNGNGHGEARRDAPATHRNREPILRELRRALPDPATAAGMADRSAVLEIASGTGQHVVAFARAFPHLDWIPSDPDPEARDSVRAWTTEAEGGDGPLVNLSAPLALDAIADVWPVAPEDSGRLCAILNINMIHIAPWRAALGLFAGAGRLLPAGGLLFLYGPFGIDGRHVSRSNAQFDASLRTQDPDWGVRDAVDVTAAAASHALRRVDCIAMPANNFSLVFRKEAPRQDEHSPTNRGAFRGR